MSTCILTGCGGTGALVEPLVPAGGKLMIDGKPLDGVLINFIPEASKKGRRGGTATTNAAGEFTVTDLVQNRPGLPVGKYTVSYSRRRKPDGSAAPPLKSGEKGKPGDIQVETFPQHLLATDPTKPDYQVDIPKDGNTKLELKASTKDPRMLGPGPKR